MNYRFGRKLHLMSRRTPVVYAELVLTAALLALGASSALAQGSSDSAESALTNAQRYTFADIAWGSTGPQVKASLRRSGFEFTRVDKDGDYSFTGEVLGTPAAGVVLMDAKGRATKAIVILGTEDNEARTTFRRMREILTEKYGNPSSSLENYDSPYYAGDGYEDVAISVGKGHFLAVWGDTEADAANLMGISVTKSLTVQIEYESVGWQAEKKRREARATRAF